MDARRRLWAHGALVGLQVANMALHGIGKLLGRAGEVAAFDRWGYTPEFRLLIGALETAAAIGLLVPRLRVPTLACIVLLMAGATATHVRNEEFAMLWLPAATVGLCVAAFLTRSRTRPAEPPST